MCVPLAVVFCGDFLQLQGVGGSPLYFDGKFKGRHPGQGRALWRSLTAVVVLHKNYRALKDPIWQGVLTRLRVGKSTAKDLELLEARLRGQGQSGPWAYGRRFAPAARHGPPAPRGKRSRAWHSTLPRAKRPRPAAQPEKADALDAEQEEEQEKEKEELFIVPFNRGRVRVNHTYWRMVAEKAPLGGTWRERGVLVVNAHVMTAKRKRKQVRKVHPLATRLRRHVREWKHSGGLANKFAMRLRLAVGSRYMITANINVQRGIANGTTCVLMDVVLKPGVVPHWDSEMGAHAVDAHDVQCLVLRAESELWRQVAMHPQFPAFSRGEATGHGGTFLLNPSAPEMRRDQKSTWRVDLGHATKSIALTQFHLVQAHGVSGHKAQGRSADKVTVSDVLSISKSASFPNRRKSNLNLFPGWFYVAVSRCRSLEGLVLMMTELPLDNIQHERLDVLVEMARLELLAARTRHRMLNTHSTLAQINPAQKDYVDLQKRFFDTPSQSSSASSSWSGRRLWPSGNSAASAPSSCSSNGSADQQRRRPWRVEQTTAAASATSSASSQPGQRTKAQADAPPTKATSKRKQKQQASDRPRKSQRLQQMKKKNTS